MIGPEAVKQKQLVENQVKKALQGKTQKADKKGKMILGDEIQDPKFLLDLNKLAASQDATNMKGVHTLETGKGTKKDTGQRRDSRQTPGNEDEAGDPFETHRHEDNIYPKIDILAPIEKGKSSRDVSGIGGQGHNFSSTFCTKKGTELEIQIPPVHPGVSMRGDDEEEKQKEVDGGFEVRPYYDYLRPSPSSLGMVEGSGERPSSRKSNFLNVKKKIKKT